MAKLRQHVRALWAPVALPNTGNVARDELANERTFLAWVRTSLHTAAFGIVLAKFVKYFPLYEQFTKDLAAVLISLGIVLMFLGVWRQVTVHVAMQDGYFPTPAWMFTAVGCAVVAVLCAAFSLVVVSEGEFWRFLAFLVFAFCMVSTTTKYKLGLYVAGL